MKEGKEVLTTDTEVQTKERLIIILYTVLISQSSEKSAKTVVKNSVKIQRIKFF